MCRKQLCIASPCHLSGTLGFFCTAEILAKTLFPLVEPSGIEPLTS